MNNKYRIGQDTCKVLLISGRCETVVIIYRRAKPKVAIKLFIFTHGKVVARGENYPNPCLNILIWLLPADSGWGVRV